MVPETSAALTSITAGECCAEVEALIRQGREKVALGILNDRLRNHPHDALLSSYYGRAIAVAEKEHQEGVKVCREAIEIMRRTDPDLLRQHWAVLHINLGKACLAGKDRRAAVEAFREGLREAPGDNRLIWELKKLGTRQRTPIPGLSRNNPLNRWLGRMIHRLRGGKSRIT